MAKIIFLVRQVEVWDYFVLQMCQGAAQAGIDFYIADMNNPESFRNDTFRYMISQPDCVLFLVHQRSAMMAWDNFGVPVYNFIQDHPRLIGDILSSPMKNLKLITLDHKHEAFIREFYPHHKTIHFMPNGGTRELLPGRDAVLPYAERDIDVLYCGSCQAKPVGVTPFPFLKNSGQDMYHACIDDQIARPHMVPEEIVRDYLDDGTEKVSEEERRQVLLGAPRYVEDAARRHYKLQIMHALDKAKVRVEVFGDNWEDEGYTYGDTIRIHARIPSAECNRHVERAKIALNIMPWFKDGCSERVFNNMLNGALCVSDPSDYLLTRFTDKEEIVYFDMTNTEEMTETIRYYLSHPEEAAQIAARGMKVAEENDTWAHRLMDLVRFIEEDMRAGAP